MSNELAQKDKPGLAGVQEERQGQERSPRARDDAANQVKKPPPFKTTVAKAADARPGLQRKLSDSIRRKMKKPGPNGAAKAERPRKNAGKRAARAGSRLEAEGSDGIDRSPGSDGDSGTYEQGDSEEHLAKALSQYQRKVEQKHKIALEKLEASNMHMRFEKKAKEMGGYGVARQKSTSFATQDPASLTPSLGGLSRSPRNLQERKTSMIEQPSNSGPRPLVRLRSKAKDHEANDGWQDSRRPQGLRSTSNSNDLNDHGSRMQTNGKRLKVEDHAPDYALDDVKVSHNPFAGARFSSLQAKGALKAKPVKLPKISATIDRSPSTITEEQKATIIKEAERKASLRTLIRRKFDNDLGSSPFNDFTKYHHALDGHQLSMAEGLNATARGSPLTTLGARQMRVDQARAISQMLLDQQKRGPAETSRPMQDAETAAQYQGGPSQLYLKHVFQNKRLSSIGPQQQKAPSLLSLQQLDQLNEEQDVGLGAVGIGVDTVKAATRREQSQSILLERRLHQVENKQLPYMPTPAHFVQKAKNFRSLQRRALDSQPSVTSRTPHVKKLPHEQPWQHEFHTPVDRPNERRDGAELQMHQRVQSLPALPAIPKRRASHQAAEGTDTQASMGHHRANSVIDQQANQKYDDQHTGTTERLAAQLGQRLNKDLMHIDDGLPRKEEALWFEARGGHLSPDADQNLVFSPTPTKQHRRSERGHGLYSHAQSKKLLQPDHLQLYLRNYSKASLGIRETDANTRAELGDIEDTSKHVGSALLSGVGLGLATADDESSMNLRRGAAHQLSRQLINKAIRKQSTELGADDEEEDEEVDYHEGKSGLGRSMASPGGARSGKTQSMIQAVTIPGHPPGALDQDATSSRRGLAPTQPPKKKRKKDHKIYRAFAEIVDDSLSEGSVKSGRQAQLEQDHQAKKAKARREDKKFMIGITHDVNVKAGERMLSRNHVGLIEASPSKTSASYSKKTQQLDPSRRGPGQGEAPDTTSPAALTERATPANFWDNIYDLLAPSGRQQYSLDHLEVTLLSLKRAKAKSMLNKLGKGIKKEVLQELDFNVGQNASGQGSETGELPIDPTQSEMEESKAKEREAKLQALQSMLGTSQASMASEHEYDPDYKDKLRYRKLEVLHPYNMVQFPPSGVEWRRLVHAVNLQRREKERQATTDNSNTLDDQVADFVEDLKRENQGFLQAHEAPSALTLPGASPSPVSASPLANRGRKTLSLARLRELLNVGQRQDSIAASAALESPEPTRSPTKLGRTALFGGEEQDLLRSTMRSTVRSQAQAIGGFSVFDVQEDVRTAEGQRIISQEFDRLLEAAKDLLKNHPGDLSATARRELVQFVETPKDEWLLAQRDKFFAYIEKNTSIDYRNVHEPQNVQYLKKHAPSLLDKELVDLHEIGNLLQPRDPEEHAAWVTRWRHHMLTVYYQYLLLNRRNLRRFKHQRQAHNMLEKREQDVNAQREARRKELLAATFGGGKMYEGDLKETRGRRYGRIQVPEKVRKKKDTPQSPEGAQEEDKSSSSSRNSSGEEAEFDAVFDEELAKMDQEATGEIALLHQRDLYADVDKFSEEYRFAGKKMKSPLMSFLMAVNEAKDPGAMRAPRTFGLLHRRKPDEINCGGFSIPKDYVVPLAQGLSLSSKVTTIDLSATRLDTESCCILVRNLPKSVRHLNFSQNPDFGPRATQEFCTEVLEDPRYQLATLQLKGCAIGDLGVEYLSDRLELNDYLKFLDLSDNGIRERGVGELCRRLQQNMALTVLFLAWNPIGPMGGKAIADFLTVNDTLQVLDLSYCGLGPSREKGGGLKLLQNEQEQMNKKNLKEKDGVAPLTKEEKAEKLRKVRLDQERREAEKRHRARQHPRKKAYTLELSPWYAWSAAFRKNRSLLHLDISHNMIDAREIAVLKKGLDMNHTLMGLHTTGNECDADTFGGIVPHDVEGLDDAHDAAKTILSRNIQPNLEMGVCKNKEAIRLQANSNCWICEGWSEFFFEFRPPEWVDFEVVPVRLHLSCDNYEGHLIELDEEKSRERTEQHRLAEAAKAEEARLLKAKEQPEQGKDDQGANQQNNKTEENQTKEDKGREPAQQEGVGKKSAENLRESMNSSMMGQSVQNDEEALLKQVFTARRMLPPGQVNYYFTVGDQQHLNEDRPQQPAEQHVHDAYELFKLNVPRTNIIQNIIQQQQPVTATYLTSLQAIPRPAPVALRGRKKAKPKWDFYKSVFRAYKADSARVLEDCFDSDWPQTKIERVVGQVVNDEVRTRAYLASVFKHIREVYKYYAGIKPAGRIAGIGAAVLGELLSHCNNFVDGTVIKVQDLEAVIIACNGGRREVNPLMPNQVLVRCTFFEALVRLCTDKFYRTNVVDLPSQAVQKGFEEHFLPYFTTFRAHDWRKERLWREEIDLVYQRMNDWVEQVYRQYSGRYPVPGSTKKYMSLEEFTQLFHDAGLFHTSSPDAEDRVPAAAAQAAAAVAPDKTQEKPKEEAEKTQEAQEGAQEGEGEKQQQQEGEEAQKEEEQAQQNADNAEDESEDELGPRLTHRAINICFNLSMMTNKVETENDKHINMTYVEFLEAFARVVDRLEARQMEDFFYHYPPRNPWKLDKKLESALLIVFKECLPKKQYLSAYNKYHNAVELELDMIEAGELPPRT